MPQKRCVLFSGHVQGVGFRYNTQRLAENHPVTGCVRNLEDGRVELIAEGSSRAIDALLADIRERFAGHIRRETADNSPATGGYKGFVIDR